MTGGFYSSGETGGDIHESIQVGNPGSLVYNSAIVTDMTVGDCVSDSSFLEIASELGSYSS